MQQTWRAASVDASDNPATTTTAAGDAKLSKSATLTAIVERGNEAARPPDGHVGPPESGTPSAKRST